MSLSLSSEGRKPFKVVAAFQRVFTLSLLFYWFTHSFLLGKDAWVKIMQDNTCYSKLESAIGWIKTGIDELCG